VPSVNAERCAAITCLNYLRFSFTLADSSIANELRTRNVGKCLYSLQAYVYEHWLDHLLAFAFEVNSGHDRQLEACLNDLFAVLSKYGTLHELAIGCSKADLYPSAVLLEHRLKYFEHYGPVYDVLCQCVQYRHQQKVNFGQNSNDSE
jgi:hypothetical protein